MKQFDLYNNCSKLHHITHAYINTKNDGLFSIKIKGYINDVE